jgi:RimJ/RimL family protein N-acetyltransferase
MTVRQLNAQDSAAYQAVRLRGLQESPTAFSSSHADECQRTPSEIATRVTPAPDGSLCVFGAFVDGGLVGILAFMRPRGHKIRHGAELGGFYVAPECRRRGCGRALLDAALSHARAVGGVRQLKVTVNAANLAAKRLYQSSGFRLCGTEPEALFVDGTYYDEEIFVLRLDQPYISVC